jgi:hypothetical protein
MGRAEQRAAKKMSRTGRFPDGALALNAAGEVIPTPRPPSAPTSNRSPRPTKVSVRAERASQRRIESDPLASLLDRSRSAADARDRLLAVRELRSALDDVELEAWQAARRAGLSWSVIASSLGMGKSGAQRRFSQLQERHWR